MNICVHDLFACECMIRKLYFVNCTSKKKKKIVQGKCFVFMYTVRRRQNQQQKEEREKIKIEFMQKCIVVAKSYK